VKIYDLQLLGIALSGYIVFIADAQLYIILWYYINEYKVITKKKKTRNDDNTVVKKKTNSI